MEADDPLYFIVQLLKHYEPMHILPLLILAGAFILWRKGLPVPTITPGAASAGFRSRHFSAADVTASNTAADLGIDNSLPGELVLNATYFAQEILDPLTDWLGRRPTLNSWYRSPALNDAVPGSSDTSDHLDALAADLQFYDKGNNATGLLIRAVLQSGIPFDQLIIYGGQPGTSIHISLNPARLRNPRKQILQQNSGGGYASISYQAAADYYL